MTPMISRSLIEAIRDWVQARDDIRALAVCGSWARGNPRPDSDLDLLILCADPKLYLAPRIWMLGIDLRGAGFEIDTVETALYGVAFSHHMCLRPRCELELTFAAQSWARTHPADAGTLRVVQDAFSIVVDKDGALDRLVRAAT